MNDYCYHCDAVIAACFKECKDCNPHRKKRSLFIKEMNTNSNKGDTTPKEVVITTKKKQTNKNPVALQFARNLKEQFDLFKIAQGQAEERCSCCNQLLPNPYTQEWLGQQCGMTKATVVHYFQGTRIPSLVNIAKLAKSLDCEFISLLAEINLSLFEETD